MAANSVGLAWAKVRDTLLTHMQTPQLQFTPSLKSTTLMYV